jgi:hypothetical protein
VKAGAPHRAVPFAFLVGCLASVFLGATPAGPFRPTAAFAGPPTPVFAAPPTADPFPELKEKKKPKRALTPLEGATAQAAAILRGGSGVIANADAVEFALWLYGEEGRTADRDRGARLARELAKEGLESGSVASLFRVAQAGGSTLREAEDGFRKRQEALAGVETLASEPYAALVLDVYARAGAVAVSQAMEEALFATGSFWQLRTRKEGPSIRVLAADGTPETLAGHGAALRVGLEAASLSGSSPFREECRMLAHEILRRFWDEDSERFRDAKAGGAAGDAGAASASEAARDAKVAGAAGAAKSVGTAGGSAASNALRENARAALAVWEIGLVCGDALLRGRGRRALEGALEESLKDPQAMAAVGLAAGRMAGHPVEMALVGDPGEPTLVELRQAAYCLFEPSRVILNLDPAVDAARFAELLYPPDLAPALFVCVETLCSPPIKEADGLAAQVREIRKLAAEAAN